MRKKGDTRYSIAVEAGWAILQTDYGLRNNDDVIDDTDSLRREGPDLWARDKSVAVFIGVLREETLRKYLMHFREVVHLPFPAKFDVGEHDPTHYRVFRRGGVRTPLDKSRFVVWGDGLIRGRSARPEGGK